MTKSRENNNIKGWALITGASRGIGFALAEGLAQRGYPLIVVGRSEERLSEARQRLVEGGASEVVCLVCDLATRGAAERVYNECRERGLEVEVLVNNAGAFIYCDLCDLAPERVEAMVGLHVVTTTELCRLFARDMRARRYGYILNVSSYAAWLPVGGLSLYAPTKSYLRDFSYALREELSDYGVSVTVVLPAGVATDLYGLPENYQRLGLRLGVLLSPKRVARVALRGLFTGRRRVVPGWINRALLPVACHLPKWIKRAIRKKTLGIQK